MSRSEGERRLLRRAISSNKTEAPYSDKWCHPDHLMRDKLRVSARNSPEFMAQLVEMGISYLITHTRDR